MFKHSPIARTLLHLANLLVIAFSCFPSLRWRSAASNRRNRFKPTRARCSRREVTLDNFLVILSKGEQKGRIFEQATYLPENIKQFYRGLLNSDRHRNFRDCLTLCSVRWPPTQSPAIPPLDVWLLQANVVARFVPAIALMIPLYVVMRSLGQLNTLTGVIVAETGFLLPYAILILAPYFDSIPAELEEAARIDGCTRLGALVRIVLPLSTPGVAACGVIMFIISWHELLIPLILNARPDFMTLPVVIASLVGDVHVFFNLMMAICLLALLPTVILVVLLQKYVVEGLSAGAVKG